jgi:hypothetical protein
MVRLESEEGAAGTRRGGRAQDACDQWAAWVARQRQVAGFTIGPTAMLLRALATRDLRPLATGIFAAGIAATVATFQIAVFTSFLRAGAAAPRYLAADAWISAAGIECFDFPVLMAEDYEGAIRAELQGVRVRRVAFGFANWVAPGGQRGNVALIGVDGANNRHPRGFTVDASDARRLHLAAAGASTGAGSEASIGDVTATYLGPTEGLATFLGAPYAITRFDTAHAMLGFPAGKTAFLALDFPDGAPADLAARLDRIERRFPEISARSTSQFLADSSAYWQAKTGAGAAILLAAMLASVLMALLLFNGIGRFVQRRTSDFISMIGHGASDGQMAAVLIGVAAMLIAGALGMAAILVPALQGLVQPILPWVTLKPVDAGFAAAIGTLCFTLAIFGARHELKRFPPDAMFRS